MIHTVTFERNRTNGHGCAKCTCGWLCVELTLEAAQARAAVHDDEWEPVTPATAPAPAHA